MYARRPAAVNPKQSAPLRGLRATQVHQARQVMQTRDGCDHEGVANPEDIDKLLAEIEALNKSGEQAGRQPAALRPQGAVVAHPTPDQGRSARTTWTGLAGLGAGAVGWIAGGILPFVGSTSAGIGAAIGGALVAVISGPPAWFGKGR